ncbi:hypothetical protein BD309DRAFT_878864, partial [Dichomitus squalens]
DFYERACHDALCTPGCFAIVPLARVLRHRTTSSFKPTYNYQPDGSACHIYGMITAKRATANLHVTTLGHGYASYEHVGHKCE